MRALRTILVGVAVTAGGLGVVATPAAADPVDRAVSALASSAVYVGASRPTITPGKLTGLLDGIKVAIVPTGGPSPIAVAQRIGERLDPRGAPLTVVVFEGTGYAAASTAYCGVGSVIDTAVQRTTDTLRANDDVTDTVADFAKAVRRQPTAGNRCSSGAAGAAGAGAASRSSSSGSAAVSAGGSGSSALTAFLVVAVLVLGAVALFVASRRRRRDRDLENARALVLPYYQQLEQDVTTLNPGLNKAAGQSLADARARLASAGQQLAAARTPEQLAQARRTTLEGLYAVRTARAALGLDPGPPLPSLTGGATDHLAEPQQVTVQGQTYQGYPAYTPTAPYYFGGGWGIPGGWYGAPFWEGMLLGSVLTGGFGGFGWGGGWGGYGAGYDNGYLTGYEAGEQGADVGAADGAADSGWDGAGSDGAGDWGDSGGGGDWGAGDGGWSDGGDPGGGWGGDAGGGDWGGGGDGGSNW